MKLSDHTYTESLDCAMKLIKAGRRKVGLAQHKLRQSMSREFFKLMYHLVYTY